MYPSTKALKRPEVDAFLQYVVDNYQEIADASQIVAMSPDQASKAKADVKADTGG
jgi:phosphate transport system substrate-binding protein